MVIYRLVSLFKVAAETTAASGERQKDGGGGQGGREAERHVLQQDVAAVEKTRDIQDGRQKVLADHASQTGPRRVDRRDPGQPAVPGAVAGGQHEPAVVAAGAEHHAVVCRHVRHQIKPFIA